MKLVFLLFMATLVFMTGCSSTKDEKELKEKEHEEIQRDFVVRDASSGARPGWIEDAELWAKQYGKDTTQFRFFSFETGAQINRVMACNDAKANAKSNIAGEIATFIDKSFASSTEGQTNIDENNPQIQALRSYVENTLAEKIQALIHGAAVIKTYWEKRRYLKEKGAAKDFTAYTCGALVRMGGKRLKEAIDEAANHVVSQADDPETKANVKKALENASENFVKAKRGEI